MKPSQTRGVKPVSPALAGWFLTTGPPGKSARDFMGQGFRQCTVEWLVLPCNGGDLCWGSSDGCRWLAWLSGVSVWGCAPGCRPPSSVFLCACAGAGTLTWAPAFICWVPGLAWLKQLGSGRTSLSRRAWTASSGSSLRWSDFLPGGRHPQSKGKSSQIS